MPHITTRTAQLLQLLDGESAGIESVLDMQRRPRTRDHEKTQALPKMGKIRGMASVIPTAASICTGGHPAARWSHPMCARGSLRAFPTRPG